jgi:transcriptional regulator GlxA family with amidase domain
VDAPQEPLGSSFTPLRAGDAFIVPAGVEHGTFPTSVRAGALWVVPEVAGASASAAGIVYALRPGRRSRSNHLPTEERASRRPRDTRIRAALAAMYARYAEALTVEDLSRAAAMSRFHFSRLFRDEIGEAPYQHLLRIRVHRAAELLRSGRVSVTEAAIAVGFHDFSRFARTFRRIVGRLPVEVARDSKNALRAR